MEKNKIVDIAREAGCSPATVSRVINGKGKYSQETYDRVIKVVNEKGYIPNHVAQALRLEKQSMVAMIIPGLTNDFFSRLTQCIQQDLMSHGISTLIFNTQESEEVAATCFEQAKKMCVSGIVCVYLKFEKTMAVPPNIPVVCLGTYFPVDNVENVCYLSTMTSFDATHEITSYLLDHGSVHPAFVARKKGLRFSRRYQGFSQALSEKGLKDKSLILYSDFDASSIAQDIAEMAENGKMFDSIVCSSDFSAMVVLHTLSSLGMRVPEDVKVVGLGNTPASSCLTPGITTLELFPEKQAELAVDIMLRGIGGEKFYGMKCETKAEIIFRGTT